MDSMKTETVIINGKQLKCPFCGNTNFLKSNLRLNTITTTFFSGLWAFLAKGGKGYICSECGLLQEFYKKQE